MNQYLLNICNNRDIQVIALIATTYIIANAFNKWINKATRDSSMGYAFLAMFGLGVTLLGFGLFILAKLFCYITGIYAYAIYILDGAFSIAGMCMMSSVFIAINDVKSVLVRKVTQ